MSSVATIFGKLIFRQEKKQSDFDFHSKLQSTNVRYILQNTLSIEIEYEYLATLQMLDAGRNDADARRFMG